MFSLQRLLGKEDKFFDLLEASALEAQHSIQALQELMKNIERGNLQEISSVRRKEKAINQEISDALCTTFITALEREDIEELSVALYKIPKTIEKIAERILIAPEMIRGLDFSKQIAMLDRAAGTVVEMIRQLRKGISLPETKKQNDELQRIESEADDLVLEQLRGLYSGKIDQSRVVFLKDLYELFEKVADRCRDAGNVISHIVLKNS
jgi:uncharacterized protein Yka (UPF0111/DUF47 family)